MKIRILLSALAFLAVCAVLAFIAWMSGYNFDHRDMTVGGNTCFAVFLALGAAIAVHIGTSK